MPKYGSRSRVITLGSAIVAASAAVVGLVILAGPAGAWSVTEFKVAGQACDQLDGYVQRHLPRHDGTR